jgi:hypothetical protein
VKTAIKLKTAPDIVPHHAAKSTIVRGALKWVSSKPGAGQLAHPFGGSSQRTLEIPLASTP